MPGQRSASEGDDEQEDDEPGARQGELVLAQPQPDAFPVPASANRAGPRLGRGRRGVGLRNELVAVDRAREARVFLDLAGHRCDGSIAAAPPFALSTPRDVVLLAPQAVMLTRVGGGTSNMERCELTRSR